MAKEKNQGAAVETSNTGAVDLDKLIADLGLLPEGVKADDLQKTGGLTPIYNTKLAFEQKWNPVAGRLDRMTILPIEDKEGKVRMALQVTDLQVPTKGTTGPKTDQTVHEVSKGGIILVGLSGNLRSNRELIQAIRDVEHVYYVVLAVKGQMPIRNQASDMWVIDVRLGAPIKRTGKYALPANYIKAIANGEFDAAVKGELPQTADGTQYNPQTGEVVNSRPQASA